MSESNKELFGQHDLNLCEHNPAPGLAKIAKPRQLVEIRQVPGDIRIVLPAIVGLPEPALDPEKEVPTIQIHQTTSDYLPRGI